jgi:hypothetical protein
LFDREKTAPRTVQRPPNRTPTPFDMPATSDHDARSHMTPDQCTPLAYVGGHAS